MPDYKPQMNADLQTAIHPTPEPSGHLPPHLAQYLMYALQAADALNSGNFFKHPGTYETQPMMKPFSHGGAPMMAAGFGIEDLLRGMLTRHASEGTKNTLDALQAANNLQGILQTNSAARHMDNAPRHMPISAPPPEGGP